MPSREPVQTRAKLIAAAHAAASWGRARRAAWTAEPLKVPQIQDQISDSRSWSPASLPYDLLDARAARVEESVQTPTPAEIPAAAKIPAPAKVQAPAEIPVRAEIQAPAEIPAAPPAALPGSTEAASAPLLAATAVQAEESGPSGVARAIDRARSLGPSIRRGLPRFAAVSLLSAVVVVGGFYLVQQVPTLLRSFTTGNPTSPTGSRNGTSTARPGSGTGGLSVGSTPTGASVLVDGKARGVTPLTLNGLPSGPHVVELQSPEGTIRRTITVAAGETTAINESIFAGWLTIYAPFELSITEGDRSFHLDDRSQIMLPAGAHTLRLSNQTLGYEEMRDVSLTPGEMTTVRVTPPRSTLAVTASEPAEVWLDGTRIGEAPLAPTSLDLGTHVVLVKRLTGGERRFTVTVTVKPFALDVDFSKPQRD